MAQPAPGPPPAPRGSGGFLSSLPPPRSAGAPAPRKNRAESFLPPSSPPLCRIFLNAILSCPPSPPPLSPLSSFPLPPTASLCRHVGCRAGAGGLLSSLPPAKNAAAREDVPGGSGPGRGLLGNLPPPSGGSRSGSTTRPTSGGNLMAALPPPQRKKPTGMSLSDKRRQLLAVPTAPERGSDSEEEEAAAQGPTAPPQAADTVSG